ncbi:UNVERIFIED_CONTAM: hypothetical protein GTU68_033556 [Idotea baltica]|nr:hypothetical protein [Idotea baltica]
MAANDFFIAASRTFGDSETGNFFARLQIENNGKGDLDALKRDLSEAGEDLDAFWQLHSAPKRVKTLILVSKSDHCANTLLYGARRGELPIDPVGIISNHTDLETPLSHFGIPFTHIPVSKETKQDAEQKLLRKVAESGAELVVLARYMQILSNETSEELYGRCINIHHSFLPSFKGARPYHQAHARGVKVIGATAHYVTPDLDEGPIITQVTEPIDHTSSPQDMVRLGRHLEGTALLRAVKAHAEHRVFINGTKTVVFAR